MDTALSKIKLPNIKSNIGYNDSLQCAHNGTPYLNSHRGQIRKLSKDEIRQPKKTEQKSKYKGTQSNKPHAFHVQINLMQNAS